MCLNRNFDLVLQVRSCLAFKGKYWVRTWFIQLRSQRWTCSKFYFWAGWQYLPPTHVHFKLKGFQPHWQLVVCSTRYLINCSTDCSEIDICGSQRMNPVDFDDPATFPLVPPWGLFFFIPRNSSVSTNRIGTHFCPTSQTLSSTDSVDPLTFPLASLW